MGVLGVFLSRGFSEHRYFHSFPTRRSSDLNRRVSSSGSNAFTCPGRSASPSSSPGSCGLGDGSRAESSEEHTSELQSRPQLVCRLRLEKKSKALQVVPRDAIAVLHESARRL